MNKKELEKLVKQGETERVEFKTSLSGWKEAVKTLAAFAWTSGERVIFGVSGSGRITGAGAGKSTLENLANNVKMNTDPRIYPKISTCSIGGREVVVAEVEKVSEEPVLAFGRAYKRAGKSTHRISREEYKRTILKIHEQEFDGMVCEGASLKDIDKAAVRWFSAKYKEVSGKELRGSSEDVLKSFGCLKSVGSRLRPTQAGILLFGKDPGKFFPRYYVTIARYPGKDIGTAYLDVRDIEGNLFELIDRTEGYIQEHAETLYMLKEGQAARERVPQYPDFVIRELAANAVAHRDYRIRGSRTIIRMFKDRIEFDSPGGFPGEVNEKNILEEQFSRNPVISKVLSRVKYIEEMGEGWNRIIEEIKAHPLKSKNPEVKGNGRVVVTLLGPGMDESRPEKGATLSERQRSITAYLEKRGRITSNECANILNISSDTALRELSDLMSMGIIERRGIGRAIHYVIRK